MNDFLLNIHLMDVPSFIVHNRLPRTALLFQTIAVLKRTIGIQITEDHGSGVGVTFALPLSVRGVAQMPGALAVELRHQGPVRVADQQDGRVKHLDLLLSTLVGLHADAPAALPVVLLPFKA